MIERQFLHQSLVSFTVIQYFDRGEHCFGIEAQFCQVFSPRLCLSNLISLLISKEENQEGPRQNVPRVKNSLKYITTKSV